jgi:PKD repeat protein
MNVKFIGYDVKPQQKAGCALISTAESGSCILTVQCGKSKYQGIEIWYYHFFAWLFVAGPIPKSEVDFSASPLSLNEGSIVSFTDLSTLNPTSWLWDFGDGHLSAEQNPSHMYASAGVYTVTLIATNVGGESSLTKHDYIYVFPPPDVKQIWSFKIGPT